MMKNKLKIFSSILVFALVSSCTKEQIEQLSQDNVDLVVAKTESDFVIESDIKLGNDAALLRSSFASGINSPDPSLLNSASCATITILEGGPSGGTFNFPFKIKVDFGTGCVFNGITRKGHLIVEFSNYVMLTGSSMTIFRGDDYYINLRKVEGTIVYTNTTTNASTPSWSRIVTNGKITRPNGQVFTHEGNRNVTLVVGASTIGDLTDNIYHITSGSHIVNKPNGGTLTATITETLIKPYSCQYITQGKLNLQGQILNGVLDYGNGDCDNQATYTHSNGVVHDITL